MSFLFRWDISAELHRLQGPSPGAARGGVAAAGPRAHPGGFLEVFPIFLAGKGWEAAEPGFPRVLQPLQQPGEVFGPVCPWAAALGVPAVLLQECGPCRPGMLPGARHSSSKLLLLYTEQSGGNQPRSGAARSSRGTAWCPQGGDSSAVSRITGSGQGRCCWHSLPVRNPLLPGRICTHPNSGVAQGAAGIEPLDGAIAKELGFVFQTPSRTCPGSAGNSWSSLPWSEALRQGVGDPGEGWEPHRACGKL